jgi:hypothetical protein
MPSRAVRNRIALSEAIFARGFQAAVSCTYCHSNPSSCIVMPEKSINCARCTRQGKQCVEASWSSEAPSRRQLEMQLSQAQKEMGQAQREMTAATDKVQRLWAALEEMSRRADERMECLKKEIEEEERREAEVSLPSSSQSSGSVPVSAVVPAGEVRFALDAGVFNGSLLDGSFDWGAFLVQTPGVSGGLSASGW